MAHRIEIVVSHHLGLSAGAAGEVHQHRVVVGVDEGGSLKLRGLLPFRLPVVETLRDGLAVIGNRNILLHCRTLRHSSLNLTYHVGIIHTDDGLY